MSKRINLKRTAAVLSSLLLICSAAGCSSEIGYENGTDNAGTAGTSASAPVTEAPAESEEADLNEKKTHNTVIRDIPSSELVKEMTIGWNLGNTMDAAGSDLSAETAWQPNKTNEGMVSLLSDSGFNVLRVPVSWGSHTDADMKIDPEWLARVKEIVDYGIDNGMFVILNTHHEDWYYPDEENRAEDIGELKNIWGQIAEAFSDYDEHLIFEGLNEPRLRGTPVEWSGGTPESRAIVGEYAKAFYETVRASGGNNSKRHLMLTGYAAASLRSCLEDTWLPENDDKVIVSVHAYLPYNFALNTSGTAEWSRDNASDTADIDALFRDLNELFLSKGTPVIIGEFGALNKENLDARLDWADYYVSKASENGIPAVWWDNNAFHGTGENFGLMDRSMIPSWQYPQLTETLVNAAKKK